MAPSPVGSVAARHARGSTGGHRRRRFAPLDGLRGIAVLAVFCFHAGVKQVPGGLLGVDLFFVISGFLITGLLVGEHQRSGRISFAGFWGRRARRLLPAMLVMLAVTVAVWRFTASASVLLGLQQDAISALAVRRQLALRVRRAGLLRPPGRALAAAAHVVARGRGAVLPGVAGGRLGRDARAHRRRRAAAAAHRLPRGHRRLHADDGVDDPRRPRPVAASTTAPTPARWRCSSARCSRSTCRSTRRRRPGCCTAPARAARRGGHGRHGLVLPARLR